MNVESRDSVSLKPAELDEFAQMLGASGLSLTDEQLAGPPPEGFQKFAPTLGNILMRLLWHEGMHYGQLTVIRKSLGLAPVRI